MNKNTAILTVLAFVVLAIFGYLWMSGDKMGPIEGQEIIVQGVSICLPHIDTSGPQTDECAFGVQTDEGVNYALDLSGIDADVMADFATQDRIEITGELIMRDAIEPESNLLQYDIEGLLQVATITEIENVSGADKHVLAGGEIRFERPDDFGLAVSQEQVLVESVIPPCSEGFDYCLYYNDTTYEGTNFESAGLRIEARPDLVTEDVCLSTPPTGYEALEPSIREPGMYSTSVFTPVQGAATGQVAEGSVYRLAHNGSCHEFETRIGTSQFENFEPGTVEEFTENDRQALEERLHNLLETVRFIGREGEVIFP